MQKTKGRWQCLLEISVLSPAMSAISTASASQLIVYSINSDYIAFKSKQRLSLTMFGLFFIKMTQMHVVVPSGVNYNTTVCA